MKISVYIPKDLEEPLLRRRLRRPNPRRVRAVAPSPAADRPWESLLRRIRRPGRELGGRRSAAEIVREIEESRTSAQRSGLR